jgi:uncharacterized protein (DUF1501 family)
MTRTSRRGFIRQLFVSHESLATAAGERTLVCVFLRGAADTLNLLVPYGDDQYYKLRPTISIKPPSANNDDGAIRVNDFYAFHPRLRPLLPVFETGRMGLVQAVGTDNPTGSHFEAQDQMENGESFGKTIAGGWLGRFLSTRDGRATTPLSAIAIGPTIPESLRGAPAASAMESVDELQIKTHAVDPREVAAALAAIYRAEAGVLSQPGQSTLDLLRRVEMLRGTTYKPEGGAIYPDDSFAHGLKEVARLIKANVGLEVACLDLSGWDTHFIQGGARGLQATLIDQLARSLAAFDTDLCGHRNRVTTIVMTEFGRRTYENGSLGTDHGRGFAMMAMGGSIIGGKIHGSWPGLTEEESPGSDRLNLPGPSGLKVLIDYRSILAEVLAGVFGHRDIAKVFPGFARQKVGLVAAS